MRRLFSVGGFVVTLFVWRFFLRIQASQDALVSLAWGLPVLVLPSGRPCRLL